MFMAGPREFGAVPGAVLAFVAVLSLASVLKSRFLKNVSTSFRYVKSLMLAMTLITRPKPVAVTSRARNTSPCEATSAKPVTTVQPSGVFSVFVCGLGIEVFGSIGSRGMAGEQIDLAEDGFTGADPPVFQKDGPVHIAAFPAFG